MQPENWCNNCYSILHPYYNQSNSMYKGFLLLAIALPLSVFAQRKADKKMMSDLSDHWKYLSGPALKNRATGSPGEMQAALFIKEQFKNAGLNPEGDNGDYIQSFTRDEGKTVEKNTALTLNDTALQPMEEFFPLPFSANASVTGDPLISVQEPHNIWLINIKDALDNNGLQGLGLPAFLYRTAQQAAGNGATAVIFYLLSASGENPRFNPEDQLPTLKIPVVYIMPSAAEKFLKDETASVQVSLQTGIGKKIVSGHNVIGFINNGAATNIMVSARYDGGGEADNNTAGVSGLIELGKLLKDARKLHNNNYLLIALSEEGQQLSGTRYFLQHPPIDPGRTNCVINLSLEDKAGGNAPVTAAGAATSGEWNTILSKANEEKLSVSREAGLPAISGPDLFYRQNIPVLFLQVNTGENGGHPGAETLPIVKFVYNVIKEVNEKGKLPFAKTGQ